MSIISNPTKLLSYINCFSKDKFALPITRSKEDYFDDLSALFVKYKHEIECIEPDFQLDVKSECDSILKVVEKYYQGLPNDAYSEFGNVLDVYIRRKIIVLNKGNFEIYNPSSIDINLYRMRSVTEYQIYDKRDIFHTPFNKKEMTASCRYSIPGHPCLYLGTSLSLCNSEIEGSKCQNRIASRYVFARNYNDNHLDNFSVLDLSAKPHEVASLAKQLRKGVNIQSGFHNVSIEEYIDNYIFLYPLIAASSFVRKYRKNEVAFIPEYIIPQLTLQWIRKKIGDTNNQSLCGIRYFSCNSQHSSTKGYNYVFPVCNYSSTSQFCSILKRSFYLTEPVLIEKSEDDIDLSAIQSILNNRSVCLFI